MSTGYESGAPRGRTRERVVESVAVEALRKAEETYDALANLGADLGSEELQRERGDKIIATGALRAVLEALPNDCVFMGPEAEQAIRDSGVYSQAWHESYDA